MKRVLVLSGLLALIALRLSAEARSTESTSGQVSRARFGSMRTLASCSSIPAHGPSPFAEEQSARKRRSPGDDRSSASAFAASSTAPTPPPSPPPLRPGWDTVGPLSRSTCRSAGRPAAGSAPGPAQDSRPVRTGAERVAAAFAGFGEAAWMP